MAMGNMIDPNFAANAYSNSMNIGARVPAPVSGGEEDVSFSDFLRNSLEKSVQTMKTGENMTAKAVTGQADTTDVVQAVTQAELTLQTVLSIRDRLISSYQDIMRMTI